jgi:hypothetical protein
MLRAAALLGVKFAVQDLATVLGKSLTELFSTMDEARTVGVLTESRNDLAFRHPLIRAALHDEMPVAMHAAWHRDAGRSLAQAGAPVDWVARAVGGMFVMHCSEGVQDGYRRFMDVGTHPPTSTAPNLYGYCVFRRSTRSDGNHTLS